MNSLTALGLLDPELQLQASGKHPTRSLQHCFLRKRPSGVFLSQQLEEEGGEVGRAPRAPHQK